MILTFLNQPQHLILLLIIVHLHEWPLSIANLPTLSHSPTLLQNVHQANHIACKIITGSTQLKLVFRMQEVYDFFQSLVYSKCFDVICVTETWLTTSILDKEILPYDYTIYQRDRGSRGGGILVAVSVNMPSKCVFNSLSSEVIGIQLSLLPCLHLYCVYIPPSSSCSSSYHSVTLNTLNSVPLDSSCVVGDFNAPDITWSTQSASISTSIQLCNFCHSKNLI